MNYHKYHRFLGVSLRIRQRHVVWVQDLVNILCYVKAGVIPDKFYMVTGNVNVSQFLVLVLVLELELKVMSVAPQDSTQVISRGCFGWSKSFMHFGVSCKDLRSGLELGSIGQRLSLRMAWVILHMSEDAFEKPLRVLAGVVRFHRRHRLWRNEPKVKIEVEVVENFGGMESRHIELPQLAEASGQLDALRLGDWLQAISPFLSDLSSVAPLWWKLVMAKAQEHYATWKSASPLDRVKIHVGLPEQVQNEGRFARTEQRGVQLLMKAVLDSIRSIIVTSRTMQSTAILYNLLKTFQPGGAGEKQQLLQGLTSMSSAANTKEFLEGVRLWRRKFQRADEIGASVPDPTLLIKPLDEPTAFVCRLDAQAGFRLAQAHSDMALDAVPTKDKIWNFSQCIMAELESLVLMEGPGEHSGKKEKQQVRVAQATTRL